MTQRTRTTSPSTWAPTRKATSGGRKSVSLESMPRIHQGLAPAEPLERAEQRQHKQQQACALMRALYQ